MGTYVAPMPGIGAMIEDWEKKRRERKENKRPVESKQFSGVPTSFSEFPAVREG